MKQIYTFCICLLCGWLLWPDLLVAQDTSQLQGVELISKQNSFSNMVFDYRRAEMRNQLCIPPEVLCLPAGTEIRALSIPYRIRSYDGSTLTQSLGSMRIALGQRASRPEYTYPYTYIEEGMQPYYEGGDLLDVTLLNKDQYVTYNFLTPFTYQGGYLIVDLQTKTETPITQDINILTYFHKSESIINLRGEEGEAPYPDTWKPDLVLGVIPPSGQAVPHIPLYLREQTIGYAPVGGSSVAIDIPICNIGDRPLTIEGLDSPHFQIQSATGTNTITPGGVTKYQLTFTPQAVGTYEQAVYLKTSVGKMKLTLSGTTYRHAPYSWDVSLEWAGQLRSKIPQNEAQQITELSVSGEINYDDIRYISNFMEKLTRLDLSTAYYTDFNFSITDEGLLRLEQLALPAGVTELRIPQASQLTKLVLPIGFKQLGKDNGNESLPASLTTLVAFSNQPVNSFSNINGSIDDFLQYIENVYVPEQAVDNWKERDEWKNKNIHPITEAILQPGFGGSKVIRDDQIFTTDNYPQGAIEVSIRPDLNQVTSSASLTNQAPTQFADITLQYRLGERYNANEPAEGLYLEKGAYSVFINEDQQATAQKASIQLAVKPQTWHFISLPFDVERLDFVSDPENGNREFVIRAYDGQNRANYGQNAYNNWKDVSGTLQAGRGYILQTDYTDPHSDFYKLSVTNRATDALLQSEAITVPLESYPSYLSEDNANWNLVGNPYTAFYRIQNMEMGSNKILVIWNGNGYTPLSKEDDDYSLRPLEAFFVQKPAEIDAITFHPEGRTPRLITSYNTLRSIGATDRQVINLQLKGDSYTDRTRLVINPTAQMGYDMHNDAVKWMSPDPDIPQCYTLGQDRKRYAINERPEGNGCIPLGLYVGKSGNYTLLLDANHPETAIYLIDKKEGKEIDLGHTAYTFHAEKGTDDQRFELRVGQQPTSNETVETLSCQLQAEKGKLYVHADRETSVCIYTVNGLQQYNRVISAGITTIPLEAGFYLVRINQSTHKVIIH